MNVVNQDTTPDVMVAIMGASGAGKATFIKHLSNGDGTRVNQGPESEALKIQTTRYVDQETGRSVMLIGTPDFDGSQEGTETIILDMILHFLESGEGERRKLNGIIYMHSISTLRVSGVSPESLSLFRSLCGDNRLANVHIVTTHSTHVSEQQEDECDEHLQCGAFKALIDAGASKHHHTNTVESARQIMSGLITPEGRTLGTTSSDTSPTTELREVEMKHEQEQVEPGKEMGGAPSTPEQPRTHFSRPGSTDSLTQYPEDTADVHIPNVVIFGETGVGKSSIINLITNQELAHTSNEALGCTFQHRRYTFKLNEKQRAALWDTIGLDEGTEGTIPAAQAERNLKLLIQELANAGGIHLLVYCIRAGRITKALKRNYDLFYVTVCRRKVPVALVVTGLEHLQGAMEPWWTQNEAALKQYGMHFDDHACVTTLNLNLENSVMQQRRFESQRVLRDLVVRYSMLPGWKADPSFLSTVLPTVRNRRMAAGDRAKKSITTHKVIICDVESNTNAPATEPVSSAVTLLKTNAEWVEIEGQQYEFVHVDKHALKKPRPMVMDFGVGLLVFRTSPKRNTDSLSEVRTLEEFCEFADGLACPFIVVRREWHDEQAVKDFENALASRLHGIRACCTASNLSKTIAELCVKHLQDKGFSIPNPWQWIVSNYQERRRNGTETSDR